MKTLFKWLLIVLVVILIVGYFARNFIGRKTVEISAEKMTGFPLEIGALNVSLFTSKVDVQSVTLKNPPEFQEPLFVDMPRLYVDYYLPSMFGSEPHVKEMLIDIKELVIVKNSKGETNASKLKGVLTSDGSTGTGGGDTKSSGGSTKYRVDTLHLKVSKVTYKTYTADGKVSTKDFPADLDVTYKNITDSTQISKLVLMTVLSKVKLPDIGIHIDDLKKGVGNVTDAAGKVLKNVGAVVEDVGKGALDTGKGLFQNIKKAIPGSGTKN